ncbi:hypothetical protein D3C71_1950720 [compost metagenome]
MFAEFAGESYAIEPGHVLVSQHEIDVMAFGFFQGILPIHRLHNVVASTRESERHHFPHGR